MTTEPTRQRPSTERPTIAEPLAYFGVLLVLLFGGLGVTLAWGTLSAFAQVAVLAAAGAVLAGSSLVVPLTGVAFGRIADTVATSAVLLLGWASGLGAHAGGVAEDHALAIGAAVAGVGGLVALQRRRGALPHLVAGAGLVAAVYWVLRGVDAAVDVLVVGVGAAGLAWWLLGVVGVLTPSRVAIAGGGLHVLAATVASVTVESAWWVTVLSALVVGVFVWAGRSGPDAAVQRALAAATAIAVVARIWVLIDDPALRAVVGGLSVGVGMVVAAVALTRRRSADESSG